ncbi:MAG: signal transduction histidine kinase LytS [Gemmatimonadetes bacterium]|nr:signal transduction histidine kinase LytS [Gemmatimonadota bacterium]
MTRAAVPPRNPTRPDPDAPPWPAPGAHGGRRWTRTAALWGISFAFWAGAVLLLGLRKYVTRRIVWPPAYFGRMIHGLAPDYVGYALLTPMVVMLADRLPVLGAHRRRNLLLHLPLGLAFSLGASAIAAWMDSDLYPTVPSVGPPPLWIRTRYVFAIHFSDDLLAYFAILLAAHAVSYYRAYRASEIRAAQLEARLSLAQLEALRSQIQPHFLFNTLHSISALMGTDVESARKMIGDLKALLRLATERSDAQEVTLAAELEFLDQYVSIQRTRFRDRLTLDYVVDPGVLDAVVPRLVLQALVENAIRHGQGPRSEPGRIEVRAERDGRDVLLVVADDGVGVATPDGRPAREGIGLGNTRARLRTLYGDRQSLHAAGPPEGGFRVEIRVPYATAPQNGVPERPRQDVPPEPGLRLRRAGALPEAP